MVGKLAAKAWSNAMDSAARRSRLGGGVYCIIAVCADEIVAEGVDDYEDDVHGEESVGL